MRKLYQTEWHDIPFSSFTEMRSDRIANADFYRKFYVRFFEKFHSPKDLDEEWARFKVNTTHQLIEKLAIQKSDKILSVGCGVGLMETEMIRLGFSEIEATEVSWEPLQWLKEILPPERLHVGNFPESVPAHKRFDWILMSITDYLFDEESFPVFLSDAGRFLKPLGRCTLVCLPYKNNFSLVEKIKYFLRSMWPQLTTIGLLQPAQLWGFSRTLEDYHSAIAEAKLRVTEEGALETGTRWPSYQFTLQLR